MHVYQISLALNLLITELFMKQWSHHISETCEQKSWSSRTFSAKQELQVTVNLLECSTVQLNVWSAGSRNISWELVGNSKAQVGHSRPTTSEFLESGPGTCVFNKISNQSWKITCEEFLISLHASLCISTFV